jgi:hypothetical protein
MFVQVHLDKELHDCREIVVRLCRVCRMRLTSLRLCQGHAV